MNSRNVKSRDAFRTIGEVAEELGVPQHVLRFWENKFASIRPVKRGGGRRYYRREDVELLKSIRQLLHDEGYTIKGVQKLLRENGPGALRQNVSVVLVADGEKSMDDGGPASQERDHSSILQSDTGKPISRHDRDDALSSIVQQLESLRRELQQP